MCLFLEGASGDKMLLLPTLAFGMSKQAPKSPSVLFGALNWPLNRHLHLQVWARQSLGTAKHLYPQYQKIVDTAFNQATWLLERVRVDSAPVKFRR